LTKPLCLGYDDFGVCSPKMAEAKRKIKLFGHDIDVSEVPIVEEEEHFIRYKLADGTVLKVKNVATAVLRVDNQFLPDGTPVYLMASNPVVSVVSSPLTRAEPDEKAN
jgi:hypothetical protein